MEYWLSVILFFSLSVLLKLINNTTGVWNSMGYDTFSHTYEAKSFKIYLLLIILFDKFKYYDVFM